MFIILFWSNDTIFSTLNMITKKSQTKEIDIYKKVIATNKNYDFEES